MVQDGLVARQIWATHTTRTPLANTQLGALSSPAAASQCTVALPAGGTLVFNNTYSTILDESITFESACSDGTIHGCSSDGNSTVVKSDDPFYASVAPQVYALATATIISYILVILIFITPRTFYVGGPSGGAGFHSLRSIVPGSGSSSVIGVGRRPLLQKIAAFTVAVSLTIATADTFRVAEEQYNSGLMDSQSLVEDVIGSTEIRVVRVVSDTFLWLAQVQTLIRLFPRHKEKVTIKWLGFALVVLDTIFSILENFVSQVTLTRPRSYVDAIPALSYLFQMSISLIYASCVIYYSLSKRRFAFWHSKMRNILLVAALSLASVLIPVVFFVLDVSQPNIATWGEYIRWVGAAAASVVVWEWVERIEALERDEKKDGILGREIFDGDEMLDNGYGNKGNTTSSHFGSAKRSPSNEESTRVSMIPMSSIRPRVPFRSKKRQDGKHAKPEGSTALNSHAAGHPVTRPLQAVTPISRSDTTSAASTVYAVRYQNVSSPSPAIPEEVESGLRTRQPSVQIIGQTVPFEEGESTTLTNNTKSDQEPAKNDEDQEGRELSSNRQMWQAVANPFKRKRAEPPAEVAAQMAISNQRRSPAQTYHNLRDRFTHFTSSQRGRLGGRKRIGPSPPMPVTVIPAQPRASRVTQPGETPRTRSPQSRGQLAETRVSTSSSSRSSRSRREDMPVTVIPAPVRGGRTWSPDDLEDDSASQHSAETSSKAGKPLNSENERARLQATGGHEGNVHVMRGALTISESPVRARDVESRSRNSPSTHRSSARLRTPTMDSLDDRINSTSPGSAGTSSEGVASRRGAGNTSSPQPPINESSEEPDIDTRDTISRPNG